MTVYSPTEYAARLDTSLVLHDATRPRSLQTTLGFSDLVCRERARRKLAGIPPTDEPSRWAAQVGTALHELWAKAVVPDDEYLPRQFPGALVEQELSVKLPNGLVVTGHPDQLDPDEPSCTDGKSVDSPGALLLKERHGPEDEQIAQVTLGYAAGLQAGILPHDEGIVRLFWKDRSGKSDRTVVWQRPYDPEWLAWAARFYDDVDYAVKQGEEAMRDKHYEWCRVACEHFGGCRGGNAAYGDVIDDDVFNRAARDAHEAKQLLDHATDEYEAAWDVLTPLWRGLDPGDTIPTFIIGGYRTRRSWVNREDYADGGYWRRDIRPAETERKSA
jgi:hypothetical protein